MQKLLIADSSMVFTRSLEAALRNQFQICTCGDGYTLQQLLGQFQPDVLIVNLQLPYRDGLTVLETAAFHPPVILATTMHLSTYVEQSVTALGIDYTMICPSVNAVVQRLQDLLKTYTAPSDHTDPQAVIAHHLHLLNIPTHLDGYRQLCIALPLFARNPHQLMTKELYPAVAKLCQCKDGRSVEHSIRKAIRTAWKQRDNAIWRKYFTACTKGCICCPTNKEFICRLAEFLQTDSDTP